MPVFLRTILFFLLAAFYAEGKSLHPILVSDFFVKPSKGQNGAAFLSMRNTSSKPVKLVDAKTDPHICKRVELHTHVQEGNIYGMRRISEIIINPGETVVLEPGKLHIMLIDIKSTLSEGDEVPLTLIFEGASEQTLLAPVKKKASCGCCKKKKVSS